MFIGIRRRVPITIPIAVEGDSQSGGAHFCVGVVYRAYKLWTANVWCCGYHRVCVCCQTVAVFAGSVRSQVPRICVFTRVLL